MVERWEDETCRLGPEQRNPQTSDYDGDLEKSSLYRTLRFEEAEKPLVRLIDSGEGLGGFSWLIYGLIRPLGRRVSNP